MTWRLTFYDESGVEIGYVEKPDLKTHNVVITHPNGGWETFRSRLEADELIEEPEGEQPDHLDGPGWRADYGSHLYRFEPEKHLRLMAERTTYDGVFHSELVDE